MNNALMTFVAGRGDRDQSLLEAARVALEANPTPRMLRLSVEQDGVPIEIPELDVPQLSLPI
jgi:hypothetical protein